MSDESLHERMAEYERLATEAAQRARERDRVAATVGDQLAAAVSTVARETGVTVEAGERSGDGHRFNLTARLDSAALVAAVTRTLPDGFVVSHVNEDGSLDVEWTGTRETPSKRDHGAILKAIVAEETVLDEDGFVDAVPTRDAVLARAVELGLDESDADDRLARLATLDVVDLVDGSVYPDENFSRY
jgi:L-rhamnose isomerase